ncbi:hypothetical protein ACLOJK_022067 [Asimina triloba]
MVRMPLILLLLHCRQLLVPPPHTHTHTHTPDVAASSSATTLVIDAPIRRQKQRANKEKNLFSRKATNSCGNPPLLIVFATKVGGVIHLDVEPLEMPSKRSNTIIRTTSEPTLAAASHEPKLVEESGVSMVEGAIEVESSNIIKSLDIITKGGVSTDEVVEQAPKVATRDHADPQSIIMSNANYTHQIHIIIHKS